MSEYQDLLRSPAWRARRMEIIEAADSTCDECGYVAHDPSEMEVHHRWYQSGKLPWEYPDEALRCLCDPCHEELTDQIWRLKVAIGRLSVMQIHRAIRVMNEIAAEDWGRRLPLHPRDEAA